jgi:hypothetical protein
MSWLAKLFGTPWKTLSNIFYVAMHWETISSDLEMYRKQIKDREDWLAAAEARHRTREADLTQRLEEWQRAAGQTYQLATSSATALQQAQGQLRQLQANHIRLASDIIECAMVIVISTHALPAEARLPRLNLLLPNGRRIVDAGLLAADTTPPADPIARFLAIKEQITRTLLTVY